MNDANIIELRNKYKELKKQKKEDEKKLKRLYELEEYELIKEYLELCDWNNSRCMNVDLTICTDNDLINNAICKFDIEEKDNIYVYLGTYHKVSDCTLNDYFVSYNSLYRDYSLYRNIEDNSRNLFNDIKVNNSNRDEFEKENIIIYKDLNSFYKYDDFFYDIQIKYFKNKINNNKENIKKMINKYKKNN